MSETVTFSGVTKQPLPVGRVLQNEEAASLTEVVVLGWAPDGSFHFAASDADMSRALMLLACAQRWITDQQDLSGAPRWPASVPVSRQEQAMSNSYDDIAKARKEFGIGQNPWADREYSPPPTPKQIREARRFWGEYFAGISGKPRSALVNRKE